MADTPRRIDIGFQGGQVLSVRVAQAEYDKLSKALSDASSEGWFDLSTLKDWETLDKPL